MLEEVGVLPLNRIFSDLLWGRGNKPDHFHNLVYMFGCNLIGMTFSRGTHQQFFAWYGWNFAFLAHAAFPDYPLTQLVCCLMLDVGWSVPNFARFAITSGCITLTHLALCAGLFSRKPRIFQIKN